MITSRLSCWERALYATLVCWAMDFQQWNLCSKSFVQIWCTSFKQNSDHFISVPYFPFRQMKIPKAISWTILYIPLYYQSHTLNDDHGPQKPRGLWKNGLKEIINNYDRNQFTTTYIQNQYNTKARKVHARKRVRGTEPEAAKQFINLKITLLTLQITQKMDENPQTRKRKTGR